MIELRPYQQDIVDRVRNAIKHRKKSVLVVLTCGGGKSVIIGAIAKMTTDKHNNILFIVHRAELCDQIQETFNRMGVDAEKSNICMVQMAEHLVDENYVGFKPDVIITDEAHHSMASNYQKVYNAYPDTIKIGFTATPTRLDNLNLNQIYEEIIESVSVEWLIDNQYLAPFHYFSADPIDLEENASDDMLYSDIIENYNKFAKDKQAICYCPTVEISEKVAKYFNGNDISAEHLDGTTNKIKRDGVINDFKNGKLKVICNVDLISEGFDVPDCEAVMLLRKTESLTLFVQQSMRSMRYKPDKTAIIIDLVGNYLKFGLPTQLHNWDALNKNKTGTENKKQDKFEKKCIKCHSVFRKENIMHFEDNRIIYTCPHCEYGWEEVNRERKSELTCGDYELSEIKDFTIEDIKNYKDCKNISELLSYAKSHKYKKMWVVYKAKELGFAKTLEDFKKLAKILGYKEGWAYYQFEVQM